MGIGFTIKGVLFFNFLLFVPVKNFSGKKFALIINIMDGF